MAIVTLKTLGAKSHLHNVVEAGRAAADPFFAEEYGAMADKVQKGLTSTKAVQAAIAEYGSMANIALGVQNVKNADGDALPASAKWSDAKRILESVRAAEAARRTAEQSAIEAEEIGYEGNLEA